MSRKFIAKVAAVALAITAIGNAPVQADDDLAAAVIATIGVAIAGNSNNNRSNYDNIDRATRDGYNRNYPQNNRVYRPGPNDSFRVQPRPLPRRADRAYRPGPNDSFRTLPRPLPRRANRAFLPNECLRSFGDRRVFSRGCLKKNYSFNKSLPDECKVKYRANGKKRKGFSAPCLRREGYGLARN